VSALWSPFLDDPALRRALAGVLLAAVACGGLGVLVTLRGLTFTGESLSHTLLPGAAVALALGLSVLAGALVAGVLAAAAIALLAGRAELGEETAVGTVFTTALAAGVIVLAATGGPQDVDELLFGDPLAVTAGELWFALGAALVAVATLVLLRRPLVVVAFDREYATAAGLRPGLLDAALLVASAVALTAALRGLGTLLPLVFVVAPAATVRLAVRHVGALLLAAPLLAALYGVAGLELSAHAGIAAAPAIASVAVGTFLATALLRALTRPTRAGRRSTAPSGSA
jgi:ABC-type Mn2+/Zn2+ transport system permease subunit